MSNEFIAEEKSIQKTDSGEFSAPAKALLGGGPPPFKWSSLWERPVINHLNGKSYTLPIFNLMTPYGRNFHLSWLGFFVAFFSWFAFAPLIPEAIREDLRMTPAQIGNSNIIALLATLGVRLIVGPLVDRYGPRKIMAALLVIGAIPSGLAGTATSVNGIYIVRFFIGILGGTFVPCQAWTTAFFDKNIVGTANALVGGWGNAGGGAVVVVQVAVFEALIHSNIAPPVAWRACFAIVPLPLLLGTAALTMIFGTDCPAGRWEDRHTLPASALAAKLGHLAALDASERRVIEGKMAEKEQGRTTVQEASDDDDEPEPLAKDIDIAVAERLTLTSLALILKNPATWLTSLMYMSTFGFELAVDANIPNMLFRVHGSPSFGQTEAGYYASVFGFLNFVTRPLGGFLGDYIYRYYGIKGKKYLTVALGFLQGAMSLAMGLWQDAAYDRGVFPSLGIQMVLIVLMAIFCEAANGANFALVPHCNAFNNGVQSAIVGSFGSIGGVLFALLFRFLPANGFATAWWAAGIFAMGINAICFFIPAPRD